MARQALEQGSLHRRRGCESQREPLQNVAPRTSPFQIDPQGPTHLTGQSRLADARRPGDHHRPADLQKITHLFDGLAASQ